jgi:hypothetical protein
MASCPFWPYRFLHFGYIHLGKGGVSASQFKYTDKDFQMVEGRTVRSSTCAKIEIKGTIFDFCILKKFDLSVLST